MIEKYSYLKRLLRPAFLIALTANILFSSTNDNYSAVYAQSGANAMQITNSADITKYWPELKRSKTRAPKCEKDEEEYKIGSTLIIAGNSTFDMQKESTLGNFTFQIGKILCTNFGWQHVRGTIQAYKFPVETVQFEASPGTFPVGTIEGAGVYAMLEPIIDDDGKVITWQLPSTSQIVGYLSNK